MKSVIGLIAVVFALNFLTMPANEYVGDAMAVRVQAITLINDCQLAVPRDLASEAGASGQYFFENANGRFYPKYGILNTFLYLPVLWLEKIVIGRSSSAQHTLFLNLFNVLLSCVTAAYLAVIARRHTNLRITIWTFVLGALYSTFWWNYLRAQTFEIYLTLFMLGFYHHFLSALKAEASTSRDIQFLTAAIYFGCLCLCKTVFVGLLPILIIVFAIRARAHEAKFFWGPVALLLCLLLVANRLRFGSIFNLGYTQWSQEAHPFTSNLLPGLYGFLVSKQGNIFLHFPVLIFAVLGWPVFVKRHRLDGALIGSVGLFVLLVSSAFTNWKGESCYGPRYLLPVLPLLSVPFITFLDWINGVPSRLVKWLAGATVAGTLAYSFVLQVAVNSLPFFFWNDLLAIVGVESDSTAARYLGSHQFGTINIDFMRYGTGRSSRFQREYVTALDSSQFVRVEGLKSETALNYYWFPRPVEALP